MAQIASLFNYSIVINFSIPSLIREGGLPATLRLRGGRGWVIKYKMETLLALPLSGEKYRSICVCRNLKVFTFFTPTGDLPRG